MNFKNIIFILLISVQSVLAQQKKDVLFTVAGQKVYADEFLKVFNKNRDIVSEENKKTIKEYLELYINYKLKLKQAYDLKYDTITSYKEELATYREQLTAPYLKDNKVTDELIKEAYDRTKREVNASHILIRLAANAPAEDTLRAYQKIMEVRDKIVDQKLPFEVVAKEYSEDPSASMNGGNLGYFSAFTMVYPFETAAFITKVGGVSLPFRTSFGYHIVKNNGFKDSKGEVEVSHIMIVEDPKDSLAAKTKIDEIYAKLNQGENFELLARLHSDDKRTAVNGGRVPKFNEHKMIEPFSTIAFSLQHPEEYSKPFKTPYGWHIVKLIKFHPVADFNDMKSELAQKIATDERALKAGKSVVNRLLKEYKIAKDDKVLSSFLNNDGKAVEENLNKIAVSINGTDYKLSDIVEFEGASKNDQSKKEILDAFIEAKVQDYYKANLDKTEADFAFTFQEYKDGLLLFNILQDKVWKFAENDTVGLKEYFKKNQNNYFWPKRADVIIAHCSKKEKAEKVKLYLEKGVELDSIKNLVNESPVVHVLFTKGLLEEGHKKLPEGFQFANIGVSEVIQTDKVNFTVIKTLEVIEPTPMQFKEAKGRVMNDYQQYVEEEWIKQLKATYPVKVNQKTVKKLVKQNQ